jgi:hypothetical protein
MSCNGWTNHATWLVNVWTDGDDEIVRICRKSNGYAFMRGEELKEYVETYVLDDDPTSELMSGLGKDLLLSALSDVNWKELVEHYEYCEVEENDDES